MGALAKLFSYPDKILAAFFLKVLPQLLKIIILTICMFYKYYKFITIKYKYTSMINKKCSKFRYTTKTRPDSDECSVCLSEVEEGEECMEIDDCKHAFHRNCLQKWLKECKATCPLCRSVVVPEVVVEEYQKMQSDEEDGWIEKELALVLLNALDGRNCNGYFQF